MSIDHGLEPIPETKPLDSPMEKEYLSIAELVRRIPYRPQTLRNLMSQGVLKEGVHYFKPTQRKVVFKWSAIQRWIEGENREEDFSIPLARGR